MTHLSATIGVVLIGLVGFGSTARQAASRAVAAQPGELKVFTTRSIATVLQEIRAWSRAIGAAFAGNFSAAHRFGAHAGTIPSRWMPRNEGSVL